MLAYSYRRDEEAVVSFVVVLGAAAKIPHERSARVRLLVMDAELEELDLVERIAGLQVEADRGAEAASGAAGALPLGVSLRAVVSGPRRPSSSDSQGRSTSC